MTIGDHTLTTQPLEDVLNADCVVLLTNHRAYDYEALAGKARLILDTRNAFKDVKNPKAHIIKL